MNDEWKNKTIKVQDILDECEQAANGYRSNAQQILDGAAEGKVDVTLLDAYAWFVKEERKYRYDIPWIIRNAADDTLKARKK